MHTKIVMLQGNQEDDKLLKEAGEVIKAGGLVAFPTETVYGLGGDALNFESSRKIYEAKGRPSDNPLIVHIARIEDVNAITDLFPQKAKELAKKYWPGPLTMILQKSGRVPYETTGGLDTVAVRMPNHPAALSFIEAAGGYIAAPSANRSGKPSPTSARYVQEDMDGRIEMIIDGGETEIGLESTIIDLTGDVPMVLRPGAITLEMLEETIGAVAVDQTIFSADCQKSPKAPGMKYRHYAPKGDLSIVDGSMINVIEKINSLSKKDRECGKKVGVIATDETVAQYQADSVKSVGSRTDEEVIAKRLYAILREFDNEQIERIYSESFDRAGIGQAIMNRLLKAAGHKIIFT